MNGKHRPTPTVQQRLPDCLIKYELDIKDFVSLNC